MPRALMNTMTGIVEEHFMKFCLETNFQSTFSPNDKAKCLQALCYDFDTCELECYLESQARLSTVHMPLSLIKR